MIAPCFCLFKFRMFVPC